MIDLPQFEEETQSFSNLASNLKQWRSEERGWEYTDGRHSNLRQGESEERDAA